MSVPTAEMDVGVGRIHKVCMSMQSSEQSTEMWLTGVYKEESALRRLLYTERMCDGAGTLVSAQAVGMPDGFTDITEVIVELTAMGRKTRMVTADVGMAEGTAGAGGWTQAFDKMSALVRSTVESVTSHA